MRNYCLLVFVGCYARCFQPFLSFGLATNKLSTRLFKKQVIQTKITIQTNKKNKQTTLCSLWLPLLPLAPFASLGSLLLPVAPFAPFGSLWLLLAPFAPFCMVIQKNKQYIQINKQTNSQSDIRFNSKQMICFVGSL